MTAALSIRSLTKTYASGFTALKGIDLEVKRGEIFALLGPNGAGKTTMIGIVCGTVNASSGEVKVFGDDIVSDFRKTRAIIGLVPQEVSLDAFESVRATIAFSRGLFGKGRDDAHIESVLKSLSLWDKRDEKVINLSGGMKRRVMIAKALAHQPRVLFLDEPTAGVDVELRRDMWNLVRKLREDGVTIILTTHYIEEAEEMADRVGVISKGEIIVVEDKATLMKRFGRKELVLDLTQPVEALPPGLAGRGLQLADGGGRLVYSYDTQAERTGITTLLADLAAAGIRFRDLETRQSSLEDIFVQLVREDA